ncbi:MAG: polysaccharide biosynthesis C-terminal domain-containing protein [Rubrivivax sp.]
MAPTLARSSLINLGSRLLAVALGLALTLYTARLGPQAQGVFALFMAVEAVLLALGSGVGVAMARQLSHHQQHPGALVRASVVVCVALGCCLALALWGVSRLGERAASSYGSLAWLALMAPLMLLPGNLSGLWLGRGHMLGLSAFMLAPPALTLLGIGLAGVLGGVASVTTVLAAWVAARLVVALFSLGATVRGGWLQPAGAAGQPGGVVEPLRPHARFIVVIGLTNLVSLLNYKVDLFLVERFLGLSATGIYSIAVAVAELLWLISSAVTTAAYARIGQPDRDAAVALTIQAMRMSVLLLLALCPLLWLAAALLVPWLLGEAYAPALPVLALLLPGVALYGAASALSAWFTNHAGRPQVPALLALGSLLLNIGVSVWAIPRWGMAGGAVATSVSYGVTMVVAAVWFVRAAGIPWRRLWQPTRALPAGGQRGA